MGNHETVEASSLIGVAICIAGNVCISCALNVQKLAHKRRNRRSSFGNSSKLTNAATPKSNERSPLLPDRAPPGIPSRPAQLERSVSDPALRNVAQGQYLLPTAPSNSSSNSNSPRLKTRRAKSSQSLGKAGRKKNEPRLDKGYYRDPLWLFGLALMVLGEFGNFLSYSFAPASLVAPLGSVALVANVGLAPLIVKEPFRRRDLLGCLLAFCGGALVVYSSKQADQKLYPEQVLAAITTPLFIVYACVSLVAIGVLAKLSRTRFGDRYVLIDLGICALSGAFTVLATKAISSFLTLLFLDTFRYPITYPILLVLGVTAFVQVNFVNKALQRFDARVVIPVQFMSFALSTIVGSAVLYREFDDVDLPKFLNFCSGCCISGYGVYLLTRESTEERKQRDAESSSKRIPSSESQANGSASSAAHVEVSTIASNTNSKPKRPNHRFGTTSTSSTTSSASARPVANTTTSTTRLSGAAMLQAHSPTSTRKLSLTLGGTQYLLAHSPAKSLGQAGSTLAEEDGEEEEEEEEEEEGDDDGEDADFAEDQATRDGQVGAESQARLKSRRSEIDLELGGSRRD